jgi:hypothetical protein
LRERLLVEELTDLLLQGEPDIFPSLPLQT